MNFDLESMFIPEPNSGCWLWLGSIVNGYGTMQVKGKTVRAHRIVYEEAKGPIPEGLVIDHLCRNRCCVNPDHLEPVTFRENVLRGTAPTADNARKTHCPRGHEFTPENTRHESNGRVCITCARASGRIRTAAYRERKRSAMKEA